MKKLKPKAKKLKNKTILLVLTGSIAAYKAGDLIKQLRQEGARVVCAMTAAAEQFITPVTLRALSGESVYRDFFAADGPYGVVHTSLAETVDLIAVAPASANFIARLAAGMADDLPSCLILSTKKPVVIAPAMNDRMYRHPLTQRNIKQLRQIGYYFVDPVEGDLVCGRKAVGHIASAETILSQILECIRK